MLFCFDMICFLGSDLRMLFLRSVSYGGCIFLFFIVFVDLFVYVLFISCD